MVKSVYVGKFHSSKKDSNYSCLVFDLGYRKIRVFTDTANLMAISGLTSEQFYSLPEGELIKLIGM